MFDSYQEVFNQRGAAYHAAMSRWPQARAEEFHHILAFAEIRDGETVVDAPSGGGYLNAFIPRNILLICMETASQFLERIPQNPRISKRLAELHNTGLESESIDKVISLAGLHHVAAKREFFNEAFRILKPGGRFCVADAAEDSQTARFLDGFVNDCNSMGHHGDYLSPGTRDLLREAGFRVTVDRNISYHWNFSSVDDMAAFTTLLFGFDRATPDEVREGIEKGLGYHEGSDGVRMNWGLTFLACEK